jgi:hypothetical protein
LGSERRAYGPWPGSCGESTARGAVLWSAMAMGFLPWGATSGLISLPFV